MQMTRTAACRVAGGHGATGGPVAKCLSERGDGRRAARRRALGALAGVLVLLALVAWQAGAADMPPPPAGTAAGG